jgi:hypothetical protein
MIRYKVTRTNVIPQILCDVCREPITDQDAQVHCSESGEISLAHFGPCDRKIKHTPASRFGSERLTVFFAALLRGAKIKPKDLEHAALPDRVQQ